MSRPTNTKPLESASISINPNESKSRLMPILVPSKSAKLNARTDMKSSISADTRTGNLNATRTNNLTNNKTETKNNHRSGPGTAVDHRPGTAISTANPSNTSSASKSNNTTSKTKSNMILLDDLYKKEGHLRIWDWPEKELKDLGIDYKRKVLNRRYIFRQQLPGPNTPPTCIDLDLCVIRRSNCNRYTDYDIDIELEHKFTMPKTVFEKIKPLVSKEHLHETQRKEREKYKEDQQRWLNKYCYKFVRDVKDVRDNRDNRDNKDNKDGRNNRDNKFNKDSRENKVDSNNRDNKFNSDSNNKDNKNNSESKVNVKDTINDKTLEFINSTTQEFCLDLFADISFLNIESLAASAYDDLLDSFYWFFIKFVNPSTKASEEEQKDILSRRMFYDHYPAFFKFSSEVGDIYDDDPYDDNFYGSLVEKLNKKYNLKMVEFIKSLLIAK